MGFFDFLFKRSKEVHHDSAPEEDFSWLWKDYERTEQYFLDKEQQYKEDPYHLHSTYNHLIDLYNRNIDSIPGTLDKLIEVCYKDIELYPEFKDSWLKQHNTLPNIPSFKRLAILFEKQKKYKEAIDICNKAIKFDLDDGTKSGYQGRIKKLQNKIS